MEKRVAVAKCTEYDKDAIRGILERQFADLEILPTFFQGKKVMLKPNLLSKRTPEKAVTTHPAVVTAVVELLVSYGAQVVIAESPAGVYTERSMKEAYKASGFLESAEAAGAVFNYDTGAQDVAAPDGVACKRFHLISPVCEADIVVDLCKLKSHALTKMTCGVKNLFGLVPGTEKVEMHARFQDAGLFADMLLDLCEAVYRSKSMITICDAILAMEGEGPGTGTPRKLDTILTSRSPYALDLACSRLIGFEGTVEMITKAQKRGLCPKHADELEIIGTPLAQLAVTDFAAPQSQGISNLIRIIPPFLRPHPVINRNVCVGCGECVRSCPVKTITLEDKKAHINSRNCIRCFCCQELCPFKAVEIKRSRIFRLLSGG